MGCFQFLTLMNKATINIPYKSFEWIDVSHLFDKSEIVEGYNRYTFTFIRNCRKLIKVDPSFSILTCNVCVQVTTHPCHICCSLLILATILGKEFYLIVIWTWIFLIINDTERPFNTYLPLYIFFCEISVPVFYILFYPFSHCVNLCFFLW